MAMVADVADVRDIYLEVGGFSKHVRGRIGGGG